MSEPRFYLQTSGSENGAKPSLRRYNCGDPARWDNEGKVWTAQCAPESACLATHDRQMNRQEIVNELGEFFP